MTSNVVLYYNTNILTNRNLEIEDIANYLNTKTKSIISRFQYIKHGLFISIKVDMNQSYLDYQQLDNIDYLSIQNYNDNENPESLVYYFVLHKRWLSQSTIAFDLYQDTINSFKGKYILSDKTLVRREHKDRWKYDIDTEIKQTNPIYMNWVYSEGIGSSVARCEIEIPLLQDYVIRVEIEDYDNYVIDNERYDFITKKLSFNVTIDGYDVPEEQGDQYGTYRIEYTTRIYKRIIDEYKEGFNPNLFKKSQEDIQYDNLKWYLAYQKSADDVNIPVNIYLYPSQDLSIYQIGQKRIDPTYLNDDEFIEFQANFNTNQLKIESSLFSSYSPEEKTIGNLKYLYNYRIQKNPLIANSKIDLYYLIYNLEYDETIQKYRVINKTTITLAEQIDYVDLKFADTNLYIYKGNLLTPDTTIEYEFNNSIAFAQSIIGKLSSIRLADRTLTTYLKIVELPYCPINYSKDVYGVYQFDEGTIEDFTELATGKRLKLNPSISLDGIQSTIETTNSSPFKAIFDEPIFSENKQIENESKLFQSEYYNPKFVYDSFSYIFKLEAQNLDILKDDKTLSFIFKATTNVSSKFLFSFIQEKLKLDYEDYSSILVVARNNEVILFNDDYINYLRNGYNYDIKNKQINEFTALLGAGFGVLGGAGAVAVGSATGKATSVIGGITSIITSVVGAINTLEKNELALQQKIEQKKLQATSVMGADDIDLLNFYTNNNKAKIIFYQVSDRMRSLLFDLFYYCGYSTQEYKIPNLNTRLYFNFIQADVVFESSANLSEDILEDIKNRYSIGITCIHKVNNTWDIDQIKENWEVSINE